MPLIYSPLNGDEWKEPFELFPRTGFLMLQSGGEIAVDDLFMQNSVREQMDSQGYQIKTAVDLRRSGDYLHKITKMIMGCGFGIAVFSTDTPSRTLGNIFFEVGYCLALGKPVVLVVKGGSRVMPSDFVRSEWVEYRPGSEALFEADLAGQIMGLTQQSDFFEQLADAAYEAEEIDHELVVERYKRAALINSSEHSLQRLRDTERAVRAAKVTPAFATHRRSLLENVKQFLRLFPNNAD